MKKFITVILAVLLAFSAVILGMACGDNPKPETIKYSVTVSNDNSKGVVEGITSQDYDENTTLNIVVTPVVGYLISSVKWNNEFLPLTEELKSGFSFSKTITEKVKMSVNYKLNPNIDDKDLFSAKYNVTNTPDMEIDFGATDGSKVNNLKKIDMFTPVGQIQKKVGDRWYLKDNFVSDLAYLGRLNSESLRCDVNQLSRMTPELRAGNWDDPNVTLENVFELSDRLNENGTLFQFILLHNPDYVWRADGGKTNNYPDIDKYKQWLYNLAYYTKASGRRILYETWNEPDLNNTSYWTNGMASFIDMSVQGAVALKSGDPDAHVSELALCWPVSFCNAYDSSLGGTLFDYYMTKCTEYGNHPDSLSWHYYGDSFANMENCSNPNDDFSYWKQAVRAKINEYNQSQDLYSMTQYLTEYHPSANGDRASVLSKNSAIPKYYKAIEYALESTDIARFSWVSYYMGEELTIISSSTSEKKPMYYVLWSYGRMPELNAKVNVLNSDALKDLSVRTGVDSKRASAIIVNNTMNPTYATKTVYDQRVEDSRTVNVKLKNIPFTAKALRVHLIDAVHTKGVNPSCVPFTVLSLDSEKLVAGDVTMELKIPGNASFYIEVDDGDGTCEHDVLSNLQSHIVRKDYYYGERADMQPYADIHENSFSVTMGMLDNETGKTAVSVVLDGMKDFSALSMDWKIFGEINKGTSEGLGVRIDFHTDSGYTYSKTYRQGGGSFVYGRWGTGLASDDYGTIVGGVNELPLTSIAPADWDGRIQLTYYMINAGKNTSANIVAKGI